MILLKIVNIDAVYGTHITHRSRVSLPLHQTARC